MSREIFRYRFDPAVDFTDIEASLLLGIVAVESLHGEAQVRLDASHAMDAEGRTCVIDAGTTVGRDLNRLFLGFLRREFGDDAFKVQRVESTDSNPIVETAA